LDVTLYIHRKLAIAQLARQRLPAILFGPGDGQGRRPGSYRHISTRSLVWNSVIGESLTDQYLEQADDAPADD
jgi:hypothetical protein